jgi:hypothetical protein
MVALFGLACLTELLLWLLPSKLCLPPHFDLFGFILVWVLLFFQILQHLSPSFPQSALFYPLLDQITGLARCRDWEENTKGGVGVVNYCEIYWLSCDLDEGDPANILIKTLIMNRIYYSQTGIIFGTDNVEPDIGMKQLKRIVKWILCLLFDPESKCFASVSEGAYQ